MQFVKESYNLKK